MGSKIKFILGVAGISMLTSLISISMYAKWNQMENVSSVEEFSKPVEFSNVSSPVPSNVPDFTYAADKAVHAVVHIRSSVTRMSSGRSSTGDPFFDFFFGDRGYQQPQKQEGIGSGVIISSDGFIVTNNHVIDGADEIEVTLNDKRSFKASLIGTDPTTDIALLKIESTGLPIISFGNSDNLKVGEWVLAVGNPFNLSSTVTAGIVSSKSRSIGIISNGKNTMGIESFIQTDAAVNPGNSGGALVNTRGELIGINTAIASKTGSYTGYSFAVPVSIVNKVVTDIKQYGSVQRALLGITIQNIDANLSKEKGISLNGVYVAGVGEKSAASEAGIKEGDVITKINDVKVESVSSLQEQVNKYRPGDKIKVSLLRGEEEKVFSVTLKNSMGTTEVIKSRGMDVLGATMRNLPDSKKQQLGIGYGVEVTGVGEGKFKKVGIEKGYIILKVNNQKVSSPEEINAIMNGVMTSQAENKIMFLIGIHPNGEADCYTIDLR